MMYARGARIHLFTDQLGLSDPPTVVNLEDRKTSGGTHRFGEPAETGQVSVMCRTNSLPGRPSSAT